MAGLAYGQSADNLSRVKKVYVDFLGSERIDIEMRTQIERRLHKSHDFQIVSDPRAADAVLKGTAQIWTTGSMSLSPRSHGPTENLVQGYLSAELVGKNNQTLWSYLVTPSKFVWRGIADDLARQLVAQLVADAKQQGPQGASVVPALSVTPIRLKGAGATFPAPLYQRWFELFGQDHPGVQIAYDAVGSGEGIRRLQDDAIDFGATDMPLSDQALFDTHQHWIQVPIILGAVVPIYNITNLRQTLNFTPEILAGIYLGNIKKWNDPQIKLANQGASLPDTEIVVVHRSDGSGTSFVWSDYLSKVSPEWKSAVGSGVNVSWPVGIGAAYNKGVASEVRRTPNSIGYVEFIYAIQHQLTFAAVRNSAGEFVRADIASVTEAARSSGIPDRDLRVSITDAPGKSAYPISSYTWLLLPEQTDLKNKKTTLIDLVRWMLTEGQKSCSALGYAPLPPEVANRALQTVD